MAIMTESVVIDGTKYERQIDTTENEALAPYIAGQKAMARIGWDTGSYAASNTPGRKGPMGAAKQAQNHKNGCSRTTESALRVQREQRKLSK